MKQSPCAYMPLEWVCRSLHTQTFTYTHILRKLFYSTPLVAPRKLNLKIVKASKTSVKFGIVQSEFLPMDFKAPTSVQSLQVFFKFPRMLSATYPPNQK